jgi:hypothetical protein
MSLKKKSNLFIGDTTFDFAGICLSETVFFHKNCLLVLMYVCMYNVPKKSVRRKWREIQKSPQAPTMGFWMGSHHGTSLCHLIVVVDEQ